MACENTNSDLHAVFLFCHGEVSQLKSLIVPLLAVNEEMRLNADDSKSLGIFFLRLGSHVSEHNISYGFKSSQTSVGQINKWLNQFRLICQVGSPVVSQHRTQSPCYLPALWIITSLMLASLLLTAGSTMRYNRIMSQKTKTTQWGRGRRGRGNTQMDMQ